VEFKRADAPRATRLMHLAITDTALNELWVVYPGTRSARRQFQFREIKTIGDSFMAAFKSAGAALDYARALPGETGHPQVRIRAGIHIGPMRGEEGGGGRTLRMTAAPAMVARPESTYRRSIVCPISAGNDSG
jgi:class 3 adenylate cyclase